MSGETISIAIIVGLFSGWLVYLLSHGVGLPLLGSLAVASAGAIFGAFVLPFTLLDLGQGAAATALHAGLGAAAVLILFKFIGPGDDRRSFRKGEP